MHYSKLLLFILLVAVGCSVPTFQEVELDGTYAIPLINDKLTFQSLLDVSDQFDFLADESGKVTLRYRTELLSENINDLLPSVPSIGEIEIVDTVSTYPLSLGANFTITKAIFKGDEIRFRYSHDQDEILNIHMEIPELSKGGEVFEFDYVLDPKGKVPFTEFTQSFPLAGYEFLSEENLLTFQYNARNPEGDRIVLPFAAMSFNRLSFEYGEGSVERTSYGLTGDSINVSVFDAWKSGKLEFENPSIKFEITQSFGFPMTVVINEVVLTTIGDEQKSLEGAVLSEGIMLNSPEIGEINTSKKTILVIDSSNSNISSLFNEKIDDIKYDLNVIINPGGDLMTKGFVTDSSAFSLKADLNIPLSQKVTDLSLGDTFEIQDAFPEEVSEAELKVVTQNTYPINITLDLIFLDENNQVVHRLFGDEPLELGPSDEKTRFISLNSSELLNLRKATKLVVHPIFDTATISEDYVQFYNDQFLDLRVGLKFKL